MELAISAIAYDQVNDRITLQTVELLFDDFFRLELVGERERAHRVLPTLRDAG